MSRRTLVVNDKKLKAAGQWPRFMVNLSDSGLDAEDLAGQDAQLGALEIEIRDATMPYDPPFQEGHPNAGLFAEVLVARPGEGPAGRLERPYSGGLGRTSRTGANQARTLNGGDHG